VKGLLLYHAIHPLTLAHAGRVPAAYLQADRGAKPRHRRGQGARRGILEDLESLYHRVANTIFESEVFVALVWLRADLEEKD
jgi:hypothetical protein